MAKKPLNILLRPRRFSEVVGQDATIADIRGHMARERPPQTWLFYGSAGLGKTTMARIMAVSYECTHQTVWGEPCNACLKDRSSFAIREVNASETSGIAEMLKVIEDSRSHPIGCAKRVIILDEMQRTSYASQNALLKPTEDAPPTTIWILCTTEPMKLLAPLRQRFTEYKMLPLRGTESEKFIQQAAERAKYVKPLQPFIDRFVYERGIGSPRKLLIELANYEASGKLPDNEDPKQLNTESLCRAVTLGDWQTLRQQLTLATAEDAYEIRNGVAGWLRSTLTKEETDIPSREKAANSIIELNTNAPHDDFMLFIWLSAVLCKICRRYKG